MHISFLVYDSVTAFKNEVIKEAILLEWEGLPPISNQEIFVLGDIVGMVVPLFTKNRPVMRRCVNFASGDVVPIDSTIA